MAEGGHGTQDVNEMFLKMGEKLGWFQHKNNSTMLQTLSNSSKKKTTKSRRARQKPGGAPKPLCVANDHTDGPVLKPQETEKDRSSSSRKKKQQLQLSKKPLSKPGTEGKPDNNCDPSTTRPKLSNFLSCFSDDSDTGVSNDTGKVDSYKQVLAASSDSDASVSNVADHIKGSNFKQTLTISSDSDESLGENDPAFVSCVGESPLGNNATVCAHKGNKTDHLSGIIASTGHQKVTLKSESPDYNETVINSCLSAASFSIDLDSLGEPLVESTRIHRRSSITYRHLIGSPEDEETTESDSNGSLFKTCIAEPSDDSNDASVTPDNSFRQLDIHSSKTETVLNTPKVTNTDADLADHLNKLEIASNQNQADIEDVEGGMFTGNVEGDSYEVVDAATQTEGCDIDPGDLSVDDNNMNCDSTPETEDTINDMSVNTSDFKQGDKAALQVRSKSKSMSKRNGLPNQSAISIHASDENDVANILDQSDASEIEVIDVAVQTDDIMNDSPVDSSTDSSDTAERHTASSGFVKRKAVKSCNTSESENACNNSELEDSGHKSISKDAGHNSISEDIHCNSNYAEVSSPSESDQDEWYSKVPATPPATESGNDADSTDEEIKKSSEKSEKSTDDNLPSAASVLVESGMQCQWRTKKRYSSGSSSEEDDLQAFFQKMRKNSPPKPEPESESSSGSQASMDDFVVDDVEVSDGELTDSTEEDGSDDGSNFSDESNVSENSSTGTSSDSSSDCQQVEVKQTRLRAKGGKSGSVKPDSDDEAFASEKYPRSVTKQKRSQVDGSRTRSFSFSSDDDDISPKPQQRSSKQFDIHGHKKDGGYKFSSDSEDTSPAVTHKPSKDLRNTAETISSNDTSPKSRQPSSKQLQTDGSFTFSSDSEDTSAKSRQPSSKQSQKDGGYKFSSGREDTSPAVTHKPSRDLAHTAEKISTDEENNFPQLTKAIPKKNSKSSKRDKDGDNSSDITSPIKPSKAGGKKPTIKNKTKSPKTKLFSRSWSLSSDDENVPVPEKKSLTNGINIKPDKKLKSQNLSEPHSCFQSSDEEDTSQSSVFRTQKPWEQNRKSSDFKTPKTPKASKIELSDSEDDLPDISRPTLKEKVDNFNKRSDSLPDELLFSKLPTPLPKGKISKFSTPQPTRGRSTCSFLASLSDNIDDGRRDPYAARFVTNFKKLKEELTRHLFTLYNQTVFEGKLPTDTLVVWNKRLLKTAGYCYYKKGGAHSVNRAVRIDLSVKVCDSAERTRDTLIHEMCHATVWLVNGVDKGGHGAYWQFWARQANHIHPELPIISRCHNYSINTKFTYKCTRCGYSIGRHSKSLDTERKVCGYCQGTFELLCNSRATPGRSSHSSTPTTPRTPNQFAMFVKEHYGAVKKRDKQLTHRDVMQELSKQFADLKHS